MEVVLKEIVIHVSHVTKFYGRLLALDNLLFMAQIYGIPRIEHRKKQGTC